ncbi:S-layer homology domain-containing protein [Paenibacillus alba]|nr:S-layer homology domain-containing protein [Paenibacillus alba]NQX67212.1 S-layer homology domain-containing protein [Paenibacillus alba]
MPKQEGAAAFKDQETIASYATDAVATMQQEGIINGFDNGTFESYLRLVYCLPFTAVRSS